MNQRSEGFTTAYSERVSCQQSLPRTQANTCRMTRDSLNKPAALIHVRPALETSPGRPAPAPHHHPTAGKRFTVRDGFHLKTRNSETQAAIDERLSEPPGPLILPERDEEPHTTRAGPSKEEIASALSPKQVPTSGSNNLDDRRQHEETPKTDESQSCPSTAAAALDQLRQPERVHQEAGRSGSRERASGRVRAALRAPAEWLIYRHRPSATKQRKQRKVDKLLHEVLAVKHDEVPAPRRPRCQSTLGSTYSQRVAASRPPKQRLSREHTHRFHRELLQPITEAERGLLRSREDNNKAVDKLLVSLFRPPATPPATSSSLAPTAKPSTPTNRFSTRRSVIRHETAVALRSRNLVSRMNELRSLPQLLEQMQALQLWKQQQHIAEHGVDIVARNRANPALQVLQKPSQTPLLPSATDHKVRQANKRKQELDAAKEDSVRRIVVRWQVRREERVEQARRVHVQSQWLLLVALAESADKWLAKFHEFRQKRSALVRISMAKRLQRYWRQHTLVKRNSLQLLRFAPSTPLSSAFFRMPVVIHAVTKLQQGIRDWLARKHRRERKGAVDLIVTAWFEFQDVKFRRIILRFRKRVRDFQVMWRAWRAITAARIKLLLLVWAKLERKARRRHGVTGLHPSVSFSPSDDQAKGGDDDASPAANGLTLLGILQRSAAEQPPSQQQKQLEDMHRHFRNGGAVHMPISAVSPHGANSPSVGFQPSPPSPSSRKAHRPRPADNAHVRQDLQLRSNMGEELQLVMLDVYTTRKNLSPKAAKSPPTHGAKRAPGKPRAVSSPRGSQAPPPLQLAPANSAAPVPPPRKKVPQQLKVAVLRRLLSDKRKRYSDARDRGREAWATARKQMRSEAFRYDVLDEMAAFQQLQAKYATFLLLHSITETEMVQLIHQTQDAAEAATTGPPLHTHRNSFQAVGGGPRKSHAHINNAV
jgi:hypothetical protein